MAGVQGIIRRMEEDGPDRGGANLDGLSRAVRHRLRDLIDEVLLAVIHPIFPSSALAHAKSVPQYCKRCWQHLAPAAPLLLSSSLFLPALACTLHIPCYT